MWWYDVVDNFGDWLGPWLFHKIKDNKIDKPTQSTKKNPSIYAVGSIINFVNEGGIVWGSGIISKDNKPISKNIKINSVRGPLTRDRLLNLKIDCPETYGDPGLIVPIYHPFKNNLKKYSLGIIPHYIDYQKIMNTSLAKDNRVLIINLKTKNIEKVLNQIELCEKTISSSLHGIIISIAYKIPTRWVQFSNNLAGDNIKFWDFFLSLIPKEEHEKYINMYNNKNFTEMENFLPLDLMNEINYDYIINKPIKYDITETLINDILDSCPIK